MPSNTKSLTNMEVSAFCDQIAMILRSGISINEGISMMLEDSESAAERDVLSSILNTLEQTGDLPGALSDTGLFPDYMVRMTALGVETGTLDQVLTSLARHYEREESINRSIKSAVTYPCVMAGMMAVVIIVLLVRILPIFRQVFLQLGSEMTGFSAVLLHLGDAISRYASVLIVLFVVVVIGLWAVSRTKAGRDLARRAGYALGVSRRLYENISACRFAGAVSLALSSGIDIRRSLEMAAEINEDPVFEKKLDVCRAMVENGEDLGDSLREAKIFTGMYARAASIGAKTGSIDSSLSRIADLYQNEIDDRLSGMIAVLEPTLVIALSLVVGAILLSVMLPLVGIMSAM